MKLIGLTTRAIRPALARLGYEWKTLFAGRRGAVTEMNRSTNGNTQIVSHHFGHSPEVEAANYLKAVPEDTKRAALALDSALRDNERQASALTQ